MNRLFRFLLTVCLALVAVFLLMNTRSSSELQSETRVVTVAAFADEEFRKYQQWKSLIASNIKEVSRIYDSLFSIQFSISSINEWDSEDSIDDISDLLNELKDFSGPCTTDIVIGFSLQAPTNEEKKGKSSLEWGIASLFGSELVVRLGLLQLLDDEQIKITLLHEIAHLFGAFHCSDSTTIMGVSLRNYKPKLVFDNETIRLIRLMKIFPFCKGVLCLDVEAHNWISEIFQEGHLQGEQNPIAAALDDIAKEHVQGQRLDSSAFYYYHALPHYDTTFATSLSDMSMALWYTGRHDSSILVGEKAVTLDSLNNIIRTNLAMLYLAIDKPESALKHLDKAIAIDSQYVYAVFGLALTYLKLGDSALAKERINATLSIDPDHSRAIQLLDSLELAKLK